MPNGLFLIVQERNRQTQIKPQGEGFTSEHDQQWINGELAMVAVCYVLNATFSFNPKQDRPGVWWPFNWDEEKSWKPKGGIRDLVRAGALIAAEIDRLIALEGGGE